MVGDDADDVANLRTLIAGREIQEPVLLGERVNTEQLADDIHREAQSEEKRIGKEIEALKKKIEKLERRKNNAEDKWLDGEWDKERYHEALERVENELHQARQRLGKLEKTRDTQKLALPDIAKLTKFDRLDRELVLLLVKRIEVQENGKVTIVYNFTV